ncbi:MAG: NAD(P)H-hydrate dehydratase [Daejeonella sp.]|uniref:NAD(P)H-hydrate dehydratase n=1 Tax=Daejeonella sp. TaxID=2805397 RepID=UPI002736212D|nr:NAD(P)H-hydrate dehydratase [Daejeonella sp.]MDP3467970.1 NAD(P)H-hydrate dehydratase [Daejeonella sp.]
MLQLLTSPQIREADAYTIKNKPISSIDLMESASVAFVKVFMEEVPDRDTLISIYCGTGNNGGDGLAIARLLKEKGYDRISVKIVRFSPNESPDFKVNLDRLKLTGIPLSELSNATNLPTENASVIIDALIGSGLNKALEGDLKTLINHLNKLKKNKIAVDVPTGFPAEGIIDPGATILKATLTITFQRPKINFFFPESVNATERFIVADIGLDEAYIQSLPGPWKLIEEKDLIGLIKTRKPFSHKGSYGHALIIAGNTKTMGAALLCADACLHSGAGLTTACIPENGMSALNAYAPEVMTLQRTELKSEVNSGKFNSIAIGPGLGTNRGEIELVKQALEFKIPMLIDADALNILAANPELLHKLPEQTILCPHMKEFDRLFGTSSTWWDRVALAEKKAKELNLIILLKNQYTFIALPEGDILINPTGNPAMAVGGMGDVLSGMIAAFLAQGYNAKESAILATYIHGKTGDVLNQEMGMYSIPPGELTLLLPEMIQGFCEAY